MQFAEDTSIATIQAGASERLKRNRAAFFSAASLPKQAVKRAFDFLVAITGLILFSPMFLLVGIAIKIETPGPAFTRQAERSFSNKLIRPLRFRTASEKVVDSRMANSLRLTSVGSVLRSSGIEGLPQLVNVLRGEMSLIGPQLYPAYPSQLLQEQLSERSLHKMKPGIIGWSQLTAPCGTSVRSSKEIQQQIEDDLYYVENWSLLLDLKIILMTLLSRVTYEQSRGHGPQDHC
jgi:lipopolysaccharide/colanic/teichoic acid biosynthesis glycosyltransferase